MPIEVRPATADRWQDVVTVFGRRGMDPSWCWCQLFLHPGTARRTGSAPPDNRAALRREVAHASVPPGLIAYVDDHPVGWSRVAPRDQLPGVRGNRTLAKVLATDEADVWWVACFVVGSHHRRSGVGSALLRAGVEFARAHGARAVEGHPVDVANLQAATVSGSAIYPGTVRMFSAAGFVEVARASATRPVMRLTF